MVGRFALALSVLSLTAIFPSTAASQVTFNFTYLDGAGPEGGFNDTIVDPGETLTRGQLRQNTIAAATSYMQTVYDGRGTVNLRWGVSDTTPGGFLASFGPNGYAGIAGTFQNGQAYTALRTNLHPFSGPDGQGTFDFTYSYNYVGANTNNGSKFDMFSIALHEMTHGMGFLTGTRTNLSGQYFAQGLLLNTPGSPDVYGGLDKFLQRGNGVGVQQFNSDITSTGFGSLIGPLSTFTNGNDPGTGLFFAGKYAREVFGGAVPMYAPGAYAQGSSVSHDNTSPAGVMNFSIGTSDLRRTYASYEIAMLLDIGYNVYNWNGSTSSTWSGGDVNALVASPWRTDMGIVTEGGSTRSNSNANQGQAPILAPYAQVTSNIVLNFAGTTAYTSTNDLGTMRMCRINLNSTAGLASTITGGTLLFGQNLDGTSSVLIPKIVQQNSGAFNIGSDIQIADPVRGLVVDGPGSGTLTFNGNLTGTGGLTKSGLFLMVMNGASNSYAGVTTVNQGTLQINGEKTGPGAVTVNNTGRLQGTGTIAGVLTVNNGGVLAPGNSAGNLTLGGLTMNAGTYDWELGALTTVGAGTAYDLITLNGGASTLGGSSNVLLDFGLLTAGLDPNGSNVFWQSGHQWQIVSVFTGTLSGMFGSISNPNWSSGVFSLFGNGTGVFLNFSPVPEPSTIVLLMFVGGGWLALRRKSKTL